MNLLDSETICMRAYNSFSYHPTQCEYEILEDFRVELSQD